MATSAVKTPWRNAACLMFLTGPFVYSKPPQQVTQPLSISGKPFIQFQSSERTEAELLFVQRHSKSGFMANTHVFPGGVLDEADYSPRWLHLFTEQESPFSIIASPKPNALPIYGSVPQDGLIVGEVAFRICAIREFFEEAGILLARDKSEVASKVGMVPGSFGPAIKELPQAKMKEWRTKVHNDAHEFISMCRELDCIPDIWSLIEWSDWLTPRNLRRRYDTVFFVCYSEVKPEAVPDLVEVTNSKWLTPSVASDLFRAGDVIFAPPQFAEIERIKQIGNIPLMHLFALYNSIQKNGIYCKKSSRLLTKDSVVLSVAQNDDLYPEGDSEDWMTPIQHPKSLELQKHGVVLVLSQHTNYEYEVPTHTAQELRELSTTTNRLEFHSRSDFNFVDTHESKLYQTFLQEVLVKESSNL